MFEMFFLLFKSFHQGKFLRSAVCRVTGTVTNTTTPVGLYLSAWSYLSLSPDFPPFDACQKSVFT